MLETVCYKKTIEGISAEDAFDRLGDENFYCLVYSPDFCGFSRPAATPNVFEMRCFNKNFELRWARDSQGNGRAVIISEKQSFSGFDMESIGYFRKRSSRYMLWGTMREGKNCLFDHRVGEIEVPLKAEPGRRVFLTFDEFFSPDPKHGNMIWRFERLTGLITGD